MVQIVSKITTCMYCYLDTYNYLYHSNNIPYYGYTFFLQITQFRRSETI
jgi:hypothetical protein